MLGPSSPTGISVSRAERLSIRQHGCLRSPAAACQHIDTDLGGRGIVSAWPECGVYPAGAPPLDALGPRSVSTGQGSPGKLARCAPDVEPVTAGRCRIRSHPAIAPLAAVIVAARARAGARGLAAGAAATGPAPRGPTLRYLVPVASTSAPDSGVQDVAQHRRHGARLRFLLPGLLRSRPVRVLRAVAGAPGRTAQLAVPGRSVWGCFWPAVTRR
jgi:hypothetical protein